MLSVAGDIPVFPKGLDRPGLAGVAGKLRRRKLNTQEPRCTNEGGWVQAVPPCPRVPQAPDLLARPRERSPQSPKADGKAKRGHEQAQPKASPNPSGCDWEKAGICEALSGHESASQRNPNEGALIVLKGTITGIQRKSALELLRKGNLERVFSICKGR